MSAGDSTGLALCTFDCRLKDCDVSRREQMVRRKLINSGNGIVFVNRLLDIMYINALSASDAVIIVPLI